MNFSAVAHDLRNPLNVMLGHMQLLSVEPLSETARRRLSVVEAQVRRMIRLLDACGEEGSGARIAPVDLTALIANVVSELAITLAEMGIEITASIDGTLPLLAGDHDALHRVMVNVLMNAADAINGTGRIDIGASATEGCYAESGGVRIEITDTGTGIPSELLPRVFDYGFTTRAGDRSRGLGLSICREIVDMHGGDIRISSVPGQGTTVRVSLPVRSAVRGGSALPPADHTR